jgi:hypothetical protein
MDRRQAEALMIDVSRASPPLAEGGFCTYQPVVPGGASAWNLKCNQRATTA